MRLLICLIASLFFVSSSFAQPFTLTQINQRVGPSTVLVVANFESQTTGRVESEEGSGVLLNSLGYVATAQHVISLERGICPPPDKCKRTLSGRIGSRVDAEIKLEVHDEQPQADFAVLRFVDLPVAPGAPVGVPFGSPMSLQDGAPLVAIGFPLGLNRMGKTGALLHKNGPSGRWITDLPLNHGDSGGPVVSMDGKVVGIIGGGYKETVNLKYVLPIYLVSINSMLLQHGATPPCEKSVGEMIRAAKEDDLATVSCLIGAGMGVNAIIYPPNEETALHLAIDRCNLRVVEYLLAQGGSPFLRNKWNTPIEIATRQCGPNHHVTRQIANLIKPASAAAAAVTLQTTPLTNLNSTLGKTGSIVPNTRMLTRF